MPEIPMIADLKSFIELDDTSEISAARIAEKLAAIMTALHEEALREHNGKRARLYDVSAASILIVAHLLMSTGDGKAAKTIAEVQETLDMVDVVLQKMRGWLRAEAKH